MKIDGTTLEEATNNFLKIRSYSPYRFGGTRYIAIINGQAYVMERLGALKNRAIKAGMTNLQYSTIQ